MDDTPEEPRHGPAEQPDPERYNRKVQARIRERQCWELAAKGWSQPAIAKKVGIKQSSVCKALRRAERRAIESADEYIAGVKVRHTAVLEMLAYEALQAWERSKRPGRKRKTRSTTIQAGNGEGKVEIPADETTREIARRDGNPAFLSEARSALADVRKVWGIDREESGDAGTGQTLATLAAALEGAVSALPVEVQPLARERISRALLEIKPDGRRDG